MEVDLKKIARECGVRPEQIKAVQSMLDEGATLPFMARYRKERTGSLDEVALEKIQNVLNREAQLQQRFQSIEKSLKERELWTDALQSQLKAAGSLQELEDLYLPYRPKRKTRASAARELGLGPLFELFWNKKNIDAERSSFLRDKPDMKEEDLWQGIRDIAAETISEKSELRARLRELFVDRGVLTCQVIKKKKDEAEKFRDYFDVTEEGASIPSHRLLAMLRGEKEGFLRVKCAPRESEALRVMEIQMWAKPPHLYGEHWKTTVADAYQRLLLPSLEKETLKVWKEKADIEAMAVFTENLKTLLMSSPLGQKPIVAIDPGFRTGCKAVRLNAQGDFLEYKTLFPFASAQQKSEASEWLRAAVNSGAEYIAVGNGTASRETEAFAKSCDVSAPVVMVSESGASIYSASEVARREFPELDLTVRGAISIGRRLQDPLAEWVKLDPKSIGVGQYQHDVDQKKLTEKLDRVVEHCVNGVGVELNSASAELLSRVSGLGPKLAEAVVQYRAEIGPFQTRSQLLKVPRLGAKAFEQAAGFLRIRAGKDPLDASAVHPERYGLVKKMAQDVGGEVKQLLSDAQLRSKVHLESYVNQEVGLPTLKDILEECAKPGRDPRPPYVAFSFDDQVHQIEDLKEDMELPGLVTNVTKFGAFVDVGVHQDGLVHISQLADRFVKDPLDVVKVQQRVRVRVLEVDVKRKRISLSMKGLAN